MGIELAGSQWALFTKDNQQIMFNQIGNGRYVQSENGKTVTLTTDSTGCLKISELPYGDYYFMEVQAPKGYLPYGEKIDFTPRTSGAVEITLPGTVREGTIKIVAE